MSIQKEARVFILPRASEAIVEQASYYQEESGEALANRWRIAVDRSIRQLAIFPQLGALTRLRNPRLANLRRIPVTSFDRLLLFYIYLPDRHVVTIVQVLHGARDIEALLTESSIL